jgi:hypothetical protein
MLSGQTAFKRLDAATADAVESSLEIVEELRRVTGQYASLKASSPNRLALQEQISDLHAELRSKVSHAIASAEILGLSGYELTEDELLALCNERIALDQRHGLLQGRRAA